MKYKIIICLLFIYFLFNVSAEKDDFELNTLLIKSVVKEGESLNYPISIMNNRDKQSFNVNFLSNKDFAYIHNENFEIGKNDGGDFVLAFNVSDYSPGVYLGEIIVSGEENSVKIPVILEIESNSFKADVVAKFPSAFSKFSPGENFVVDLDVYNLASGRGDFLLNFSISNFRGENILSESQELNVNNYIQIRKTFLLPQEIESGDYVFFVSVTDLESNSIGLSSLLFTVSSDLLLGPDYVANNYYLYFSLFLILILIVAFFVVSHYWNRRLIVSSNQWRKQVSDIKKNNFGNFKIQIRKLEYQKSLLDKAYNYNFIKKPSYEEGKKRINELIKRLKKRL